MSLTGEKLADDYEIGEALGHGATSVVYQAVRISDGKLFAVKFLHGYLLEKKDTVKRFEQEARAAILLSHPHIVKVHEIKRTTEGQPYIVMDYVQGQSLSDLIPSMMSDAAIALKLFIQISEAMNHAHVHGVIHRSLKPGNVIVHRDADGQEQALVTDFGLAKLLPSSGQEIMNLTKKGAVIGSPLYMSPEQCLGRDVDARSDIYSMGCLMYICLCGKPPLKGEHIIETMSKHVSEIPLTFDKVCPELNVPDALQAVVFKCLSKRPEDRYESMESLRQDLLLYLEGKQPKAVSTPSQQASDRAKEEPEIDDDRVLKIGLLVILALLVGLAVYALWKTPQFRNPDDVELSKETAQHRKIVHPISSLALLKQADELTLMNRNVEARALYREVISKGENREQSHVDNEVLATAHFGLATLYKKMAKWTDAEKETRVALYIQGLCPPGAAPGKDRLQLELADCMMHQGKLDESKKLLLAFKREAADPLGKARADLMLADAARVGNNNAEAESYELSALEFLKGQGGIARREYCAVLSRYSEGLIRKKQYSQAVVRLKAAINEHPPQQWDGEDFESTIFLTCEMARVFACMRDYKAGLEACNAMSQTLEDNSLRLMKQGVKPPDAETLTQTMAVLQALSSNASAAEKSLLTGVSFEGEHLGRIATICRIMIADNHPAEAMVFLSKYRDSAMSQLPSKAEYYVISCLASMQQGKNDDALKDVDQAIEVLRPTNEEALHLYCLHVKCRVLRQLHRADAADLIEKHIGKPDENSAAFDYLLPAYQRGGTI